MILIDIQEFRDILGLDRQDVLNKMVAGVITPPGRPLFFRGGDERRRKQGPFRRHD